MLSSSQDQGPAGNRAGIAASCALGSSLLCNSRHLRRWREVSCQPNTFHSRHAPGTACSNPSREIDARKRLRRVRCDLRRGANAAAGCSYRAGKPQVLSWSRPAGFSATAAMRQSQGRRHSTLAIRDSEKASQHPRPAATSASLQPQRGEQHLSSHPRTVSDARSAAAGSSLFDISRPPHGIAAPRQLQCSLQPWGAALSAAGPRPSMGPRMTSASAPAHRPIWITQGAPARTAMGTTGRIKPAAQRDE
jgi:hypothetical protein